MNRLISKSPLVSVIIASLNREKYIGEAIDSVLDQTYENIEIIENIVKSKKRTLLRITEGEEDLLVLPLVVALPLEEQVKHLVFYGQPPVTDSKNPIPEGIVLVDVNKKIQKTCNSFMKFMEKSK